jgi:RNA polymerase sigma-70 factor (ECF subfamily)
MRIILIYTYVPAIPLAIDHRKGIVSTAELAPAASQQSVHRPPCWLRACCAASWAMPRCAPTGTMYLHLMKTGKVPPAGNRGAT